MKKTIPIVLLLALGVFSVAAYAGPPITTVTGSGAFTTIQSGVASGISKIVSTLQSKAVLWLSAFVLIQAVVTNLGLLKSGADLEAIFGKLIGSLLWFGFCFYVVANGSQYIDDVGGGFLTEAGSIVGGGSFSAGDVMDKGVIIGANLISTIKAVSGITDIGSIVIAGICAVFILVVMAFIACKIFLLKIELALVVMLSPLSFSFLGLNALKDQGIAPFKSLISLLYRIILVAVLVASINEITQQVNASLLSIYDNSSWWQQVTGMGNGVWPALLGITTCFLIFGYLVFKSDSIAASLASGSTNLGTSDLATAAAMGAAAGAAIGAGATGAATSGAKGSQTMGDFLKGLGNSGSVSNASGSGVGATPVGAPPVAPASASMGGGAASNKPPSRPATAKPAAPPSSASSSASSAGGSGETAGIGGPAPAMEKQRGELADAFNQPKEKPGFKDHLKEINQHVANEQAATHVSISTHNME